MAIPLVLVTMAVAVWPSSAHLVNIMPAQLENGEPGLNVTFTLDDLLDTPINVIVHLEARINVAREDGKHIPALAEIIGPNQPVLLINGKYSRPNALWTARELFLRTIPRTQLRGSPSTTILVPLCDELTKVTAATGINEIHTVDCFPPSTLLTLRACSRYGDSSKDYGCETTALETPEAITFAPRDFAVVTNSTHSFTVAWSAPQTSIPVGIERNSLDHFELYVPLRFRFMKL